MNFKPLVALLATQLFLSGSIFAADRLVFEPPQGADNAKHIVLVSGDEEYRTEESMPMLGKILSQRHGFKCTVLFALAEDGSGYIDSNNQKGIVGWESLDDADLMIIGTRFRRPSAEDAKHVTDFLNAGKPMIGTRTSTHAFTGDGDFGGVPYGDFGLKLMGETWVSHHGSHKVQGARGVVESGQSDHPILNGVGEIFCPSDVYGVRHLTDRDKILLRAAVTESLDPKSPNVDGEQNDPMQPFAWVHEYDRPNGEGTGRAFCTTGGASVDFVNENLRRMIVNAVYYLLDQDVPESANVEFVDPFYPSFYGFIREEGYWKNLNLRPEDLDMGKTPHSPDPKNSPRWEFRPVPSALDDQASLQLRKGERIALVGGSLAERMNLFGYFETLLHTRFPEKELVFRNFGWPADEVANQQRPSNYTKIDDPMEEFGPELFVCFFGFNEHFAGDDQESVDAFVDRYGDWIEKKKTSMT